MCPRYSCFSVLGNGPLYRSGNILDVSGTESLVMTNWAPEHATLSCVGRAETVATRDGASQGDERMESGIREPWAGLEVPSPGQSPGLELSVPRTALSKHRGLSTDPAAPSRSPGASVWLVDTLRQGCWAPTSTIIHCQSHSMASAPEVVPDLEGTA